MAFKGKRSRSIRTRLFLLLLAAFLPILIIQGHIYYERYETRRAEELRANLELARAVGMAFNGLVQDILHQELAIAIAATASPPLSEQHLVEILSRSAEDYHHVARFSWVSAAGRVLASSDSDFTGIDISERDYFREIVSGREWVVSDLVPSKVAEELIFTIARAIRNGNGELLGLCVATIHPDRLKEVLAVNRAKDAGVSLIDSNGMHVFRYPALDYTDEQRNWLKMYPELQNALEGREIAATVKSGFSGKKRLVGFAPVPSIGWVATASRSEEDVMAAITPALVWHGSLFLVVTLFAFGIALALSGRISKSIMKLRDHALALGQGEVERAAEITPSPSEVEQLANAFNKMAEEVRNREEGLRNSEKRMRAIIESTEEAIITIDGEQRCLEANPAAGAITGIPHDQLAGRFLWEFIDSDYDLSSAWEGFLKTGRFRGEVRIRHSSGPPHIVEASGIASISPGRHLFVGHDITERKRAEEALWRAHDELDLRVKERTAELERRNLELQSFTFVAAHDLQEPLRKIQTFGDLVADKCSDSVGKEGLDYIRRMRETAARMQQVLHSLIQYSRLTSRAEPFRRIDLGRIAGDAVSNFELEIRASDASVEIGSLPEIEADAGQMLQLLQNLLGNALKFRREGERLNVKIHADCKSCGGSGNGQCKIYVEDNGIGFDEKYLDKVFAPFQRLHARGEYEGVGMGLSICSKIVERHKGAITAKSTPGMGSIFIVTLPANQGEK